MMFLIYFQLGLCALVTAIAGAVSGSWAASLSALGGSAVTLFNLYVLVAVWPRILANKKVALATTAIVFKFAILGLILYVVTHTPTIQLGWFALGLATVLPSVVATALRMPKLFPADDAEPTP